MRRHAILLGLLALVLSLSAFGSVPKLPRHIPRTVRAVTFDPNSISGLLGWFDASQIGGLSDGDPISTWSDLSSSADDLTQTSTSRPTWVANSGWGKGVAVARFDGTNDYMSQSANLTFDAFSAFVVANCTAKVAQGAIFSRYGGGGAPEGEEFSVANDNVWAVQIRRGAGTQSQSPAPSPWVCGSPHVYEVHYAGAGTKVEIVQDTESGGSSVDANLSASSVAQKLYVGAKDNGFGGYQHNIQGDIGEVLLYDHRLSTSDTGSVEFYLSSKWGTPVPFSLLQHPDTAPDLMWKAAMVEQAGWWRF